MKYPKLCILALAVFVASSISAFAQQCPMPYNQRDRDAVHDFFVGAPGTATVSPALRRMHTIALQILTTEYSFFQRSAINNEYLAYLMELNRLGQEGLPRVGGRTRRYLAQVINLNNLGLAGTQLQGATLEEARANSAIAAAAIEHALETLWRCF